MPNELFPLDPTTTVPPGRPEEHRTDEPARAAGAATLSAAMRTSLDRSGGAVGILLAAAPAVAFVAADAAGGLT
ncbi:hypothetical protein [Pseudonocardia alni]|uniref:hypothetical protein n=1 Tax=Pseudonocardia alni TaxID=33907 RepID=UPI0027A3F080|nr:hypothetical protein PaSha_10645 [Pseudonocardia alni]